MPRGVQEWALPVCIDSGNMFSSNSADAKGHGLSSGQLGNEAEPVSGKDDGSQCPRSCEHYLPEEAGHPGSVTALPGGLGQILFSNRQASDKEEEVLNILQEILHEAYLKWPETPNSTPGTVKA